MNIKCPRQCGRAARLNPVFGVMPCLQCISGDQKERKVTKSPEFYTSTQQTRVQNQRDDYERDMVPMYTHEGKPSAEFAKAFPDKAKELFEDYTRITGNEVKL